jgi:hypothetical protein
VRERDVDRHPRHTTRHGTIVPGGCDVVTALPA